MRASWWISAAFNKVAPATIVWHSTSDLYWRQVSVHTVKSYITALQKLSYWNDSRELSLWMVLPTRSNLVKTFRFYFWPEDYLEYSCEYNSCSIFDDRNHVVLYPIDGLLVQARSAAFVCVVQLLSVNGVMASVTPEHSSWFYQDSLCRSSFNVRYHGIGHSQRSP